MLKLYELYGGVLWQYCMKQKKLFLFAIAIEKGIHKIYNARRKHFFFFNIALSMKLSNYIIINKCKNGVILFSTISKCIIKVNYNFFNEMQNLDLDHLKYIKTYELEYLIKNYFLVNHNVNEKSIINYLMDKDR